MKISEQWLRTWVNPQVDSDTLAEQLTMAGLEVDATDPVARAFSNVVVGEVLTVEPHPDADKLRVTTVNVGKTPDEPLQIVCGAPNVAAGMKVPVAMVGAVLPDGLEIKKSKLRGVESQGMLCGASEIDLTDKVDGLLELASDAPIGENIRHYLDLDARIIDVSITPNRGDCFSVRGLARELAVVNELDFTDFSLADFARSYGIAAVQASNEPTRTVTSATSDCPRYLAQRIAGVDAKAATPSWMVRALERSGLQTRSLLVDVTNFVLMYLGQPLHAFDADKLQGSIQVRHAKAGETLVLLDEQEVTFLGDELVIADDSGAIALAGIMGGLSTSITDETQNVLIESAFFAPLALAGRARRFGLHTDASQRFERGVDFELPAKALELASSLIVSLAGGTAHQPSVHEDAAHLPSRSVVGLTKQALDARLGVDISASTVGEIFTRLGLEHGFDCLDDADQTWQVTAPSHRYDIAIAEDLIEEVARIYGYDHIPIQRPSLTMQLKPKADQVSLQQVRELLKAQGYFEAVSFSFCDAKTEALLNTGDAPVALANPISSDLEVMRTSLLSSLLPCVQYNLNRQENNLKFFEVGLRFSGQLHDLKQIPTLALVSTGVAGQESWHKSSQSLDFYDIKQDVMQIFELHYGSVNSMEFCLRVKPSSKPWLHPGQSADIFMQDTSTGSWASVGYVGALHPSVCDALDLPKTWCVEIDAQYVLKPRHIKAQPLPRFPKVRRDIAVVVDQACFAQDLLTVARQVGGALLVNAWVFDVYEGEHVASGKKSVALALVWQDFNKTLEDEQTQEATSAVVAALAQQFDAELRMS